MIRTVVMIYVRFPVSLPEVKAPVAEHITPTDCASVNLLLYIPVSLRLTDSHPS
jgi:hypothetical protein